MRRFFSIVLAMGLSSCGGAAERSAAVPMLRATSARLALPASGVPPARFQAAGFEPVPVRSWILPKAKVSQLVYVSSTSGNVVNIYSTAGKMLGQISGKFLNKPDGMAVDSNGNLYVTNYGAGTTLIFAKGSKTPKLTLTDAGTSPVDVVVAGNGTVFVSNGSGHNGPGFIDVYKPGAKKPFRTLEDSASDPLGLGVTLDAKGNLYWSISTGRGAGPGTIDEFAGAKGAPIATNIPLNNPGGLAFDSHSNLVVCDVTVPAVDVFPPGKTMPSLQFARVGEPLFHAFNPAESEDYVADFKSFDVGVYSYPAGTLKRKIVAGLSKAAPQGIALDPRAKY